MILVDTSVWVDHLRRHDPLLVALLEKREVLVHPWVTGELALGNMRKRDETLHLLGTMPRASIVGHDEVLGFISDAKVYGLGIGLVDAQFLASVRAASGTLLWTRDRRLADVAARLALHRNPDYQAIDFAQRSPKEQRVS